MKGMNMNCHPELDDSLMVDAEYHLRAGRVNWAIALGRHDIQHAVSTGVLLILLGGRVVIGAVHFPVLLLDPKQCDDWQLVGLPPEEIVQYLMETRNQTHQSWNTSHTLLPTSEPRKRPVESQHVEPCVYPIIVCAKSVELRVCPQYLRFRQGDMYHRHSKKLL
jgi:hypothetical protein